MMQKYAFVIFRLAGITLALGAACPEMAQTHWAGSVSSDWFDADNWSGGLPDLDNNTHIDTLGPNPTVISDQGGQSRHLYAGFSASGSLTVDNAGSLISTSATLGNAVTAAGTVRVSGAGSSWAVGGSYFEIGNRGSGQLIIENAGQVHSSGLGGLGRRADGNGSVLVSGADSTWYSGSMYVGWGSTGVLTITDGGQVFSASGGGSRVAIGHGSSGQGQIVIAGPDSTLTTSPGNVEIGDSGSGTLLLTDQAMLAIHGSGSQGGVLQVARLGTATGILVVGAPDGDAAETPGQIEVLTLRFGQGNGSAVFNHTGIMSIPANIIGPFVGGSAQLSFLSGTTLFEGTEGALYGHLCNFSGNTAIAADATFGAAGTLGEVTNHGALKAGADGQGVLVIDGDYVHGPDAQLQISIGSASATGLLDISGHADLQGGTVAVSLAPGPYPQPLDSGLYPILTAAGGITGQFDGLAPGASSSGLALVQIGDTVYFDVNDGLFADRVEQ